MKDSFYQSVVEHSPVGYAYHKIVCDEAGKPCDYEYIEVNPAFEKLTGFISEEIIGKRITRILPEIINDAFDWIGFYGNIALNGEKKSLNSILRPLISGVG